RTVSVSPPFRWTTNIVIGTIVRRPLAASSSVKGGRRRISRGSRQPRCRHSSPFLAFPAAVWGDSSEHLVKDCFLLRVSEVKAPSQFLLKEKCTLPVKLKSPFE
ncbi:Protein of unknown function, partial [Gryllus bimaculatus]